MLTCHGQIKCFNNIPLDDAYAAPIRLTQVIMSLGAGELTVFAPVTSGRIHGKRFWCHGSVLSSYSAYTCFVRFAFSIKNK